MSTIYTIAILASLLACGVGFLSILIPFRFLGIRTRGQGFLLLVVSFFVMCYSGYQFSETNKGSVKVAAQAGLNEVTPTTPMEAKEEPDAALPTEQKSFLQKVTQATAAYNAGANDMAKGATRPARARSLCALSGSASDWIGTIYQLSSNSDGKGVLAISLGSNVYVKTWNNEASDFNDHTLIDPSSTLFANASALAVGQKVKFSGHFAKSDTDCFEEGSLTMAGSMTEPEFIMRFADIQKQ